MGQKRDACSAELNVGSHTAEVGVGKEFIFGSLLWKREQKALSHSPGTILQLLSLHGRITDLAAAAVCGCRALLMNKAPVANFNAVFKILTLDKYLKNRRLKTHVNLRHKYFKGADFPLPSPRSPCARFSFSPLLSTAIHGNSQLRSRAGRESIARI